MPTFDIVVVGSGGGPSETNISAYLLKAHDLCWKDGIVGLEAGSGLGALNRILELKPNLFVEDRNTKPYSASQIYSFVRAFLISHAHLDHVLGLTLLAGAVGGPRKSIRASTQVLKDLEDNIFKPSRVWPNLASWKKEDADYKYLYDSLDFNAEYTTIHDDISVCMMPVSHGSNPVQYQSSTFFIRHSPTARELLFFGDVEPDSVAAVPQNIAVWRKAAPMIPHNLDTIFIECSYPSGRPDDQLYGHLTPDHLVQELETLAKEILRDRLKQSSKSPSPNGRRPSRKRQRRTANASSSDVNVKGVLKGLRIIVMHFKDDMVSEYEEPIHTVISNQVRKLVEARELGAEVVAAVQGDHIVI